MTEYLGDSKKHITTADRFVIGQLLGCGRSFKEIAKTLDHHTLTIAREIKSNRKFILDCISHDNYCISYSALSIKNLCEEQYCQDYIPSHCVKLDRKPYVCNRCKNEERTKRSMLITFRQLLNFFRMYAAASGSLAMIFIV